MKKLVILGCENSHADSFLNWIYGDFGFSNAQVIGLYSEEDISELAKKYNVPIMKSYDEAVGRVDGVIVTARHGAKHYQYAKRYIDSGVPIYIDKPITVDGEEAVRFMKELKNANVKISGGSLCKHDPFVQTLKSEHLQDKDGKTIGGFVRAPLQPTSVYGGFYFYAQHLVEIVCEIFGRYPLSIRALRSGNTTQVLFRYDDFCVNGLYANDSYAYFASRQSSGGMNYGNIFTNASEECSKKEFKEYYDLLFGGEQKISYDDFIAPVFIMNTIVRAVESGREEVVNYLKV